MSESTEAAVEGALATPPADAGAETASAQGPQAETGPESGSDPKPGKKAKRRGTAGKKAGKSKAKRGDSSEEPFPDPRPGAQEGAEESAAASAEDAAAAESGAQDREEQGEQREAPAAPDEGEDAGTDELSEDELVRQVSALLFACPDPLPPARIAKVLGTKSARVKETLGRIQQRLAEAGLGFELRGLAGGSTFMTPPALADTVAGLSKHAAVERISPAALESLAVIAYRQPVTKAEVEAIRGVQAGPVLRSLVDRGLVRIVGRSEEPGHALQYGTTKDFLARFGLESLDDLPRDGELARG